MQNHVGDQSPEDPAIVALRLRLQIASSQRRKLPALSKEARLWRAIPGSEASLRVRSRLEDWRRLGASEQLLTWIREGVSVVWNRETLRRVSRGGRPIRFDQGKSLDEGLAQRPAGGHEPLVFIPRGHARPHGTRWWLGWRFGEFVCDNNLGIMRFGIMRFGRRFGGKRDQRQVGCGVHGGRVMIGIDESEVCYTLSHHAAALPRLHTLRPTL